MQASQGEVGTGLATTAPARKGALCSPRNAYARRPAAAGEEEAGRQAHAGRLRRELPLTYTTTSEARGMRAVDPTADVRPAYERDLYIGCLYASERDHALQGQEKEEYGVRVRGGGHVGPRFPRRCVQMCNVRPHVA